VLTPYGPAYIDATQDDVKLITFVYQLRPGTDLGFELNSSNQVVAKKIVDIDESRKEEHSLEDGDVVLRYNELQLLNHPENTQVAISDLNHAPALGVEIELQVQRRVSMPEKLVYTVRLLFWGTGCYFPVFNQTFPKKTKLPKFDRAWTPVAYLNSSDIKTAVSSPAFDYCIKVPFGSYARPGFKLQVNMEDICRVWPGYYLNDTLIDLCFARIIEKVSWLQFK